MSLIFYCAGKCLYAGSLDIGLLVRIFAWYLHSCVGIVGHPDFRAAMVVGGWSSFVNRHGAHHCLEPCSAKLHQIDIHDWRHLDGSFPIGRWFYVTLLSYASTKCIEINHTHNWS